jgi:hypothetical protein
LEHVSHVQAAILLYHSSYEAGNLHANNLRLVILC